MNGQFNAAPQSSEHLWDIFLSHNTSDKTWVEGLTEQLEAEPLEDKPDSKKIRVFLDIWEIEAGENMQAASAGGLL